MIDEDVLNHGKSYLNKNEFEKAIKVFRNNKDFKKGTENDEARKTLLAYCLFNLKELPETMAIAKTVKSDNLLCKELASTLICSSLLKLERYEEAYSVMKTYLKDNRPKLYLRTIKILLEDIADGIIKDEKIISEVQVLATKYNISL
jgi:tetratricopeptide (TPR) repeat protein